MMDFLIDPFYYNWLILGAVLLIVEVLSFTLLFFWIALAAFIMAGISFIFPEMTLTQHLWGFAIVAVVCTIAWHRLFKKTQSDMGDNRINNRAQRYVGKSSVLTEAVINGSGKIQIEDSFWRVECDTDLPKGSVVKIIATDGVILKVTAKQ